MKYLSNKNGFLGIDNKFSFKEKAVIVPFGLEKTVSYGGGTRNGPKEIIKAMKTLQSQSTSCPSSISQAAACEALTKECTEIVSMKEEYKKRHDTVVSGLNQIDGVECKDTDGTFYIFPSFNNLIKDSKKFNDDRELAAYLLEEAKVAAVPGSAFGLEPYFRVSYATSMEKLKVAMERIKSFCNNLN